MKVNAEEKEDRYGAFPACRVSGKDANPQAIHEWLFRQNGSGYKYAIVFDCMPDEWEELPKETEVYFFDDICEEVMEYIGTEKVKKWLEKRGVI